LILLLYSTPFASFSEATGHVERRQKNSQRISNIPWFFFTLFLSFAFETAAEGSVILRPYFSVTEEYTDNFHFTQQDKKEELITILSPGLILTQKSRDLILEGRYLGGMVQHLNDSEANRYRQALALNIDFPFLSRSLKGVAVHFSERAEHSQNRYATPNRQTEPAFFVGERGKIDTLSNRASLQIDAKWSPEWFSTFTYNNAYTHYRGSLLEDVLSHKINLSGRYAIDHNRSSLTVSYGMLHADFEISKNANATDVSIGVDHLFDPTSSLHVVVGESWAQGGRTLISEVGVLKQVQLTRLGIDYLRSVEAGDGIVAAVVLRQGLSAEVTYPITVKSLFALGLEYTNQTALSGPPAETFSTGLTFGLTTRLSPTLSWSIRYAHIDDRGRGVSVEDAQRNAVSFTFYASPVGWKGTR
jgi:hypothetical protein